MYRVRNEFGFTIFWPVTGGPVQFQWPEISGDFDTVSEDLVVEEVLLEVLPFTALLAHKLGLRSPYVVLADLSDEGHIGRFVDGTESHWPIILVDPNVMRDYRNLVIILQDTLRHELGHAYLRSCGIEYDSDEETLVEEFALDGNVDVLTHYVAEAV